MQEASIGGADEVAVVLHKVYPLDRHGPNGGLGYRRCCIPPKLQEGKRQDPTPILARPQFSRPQFSTPILGPQFLRPQFLNDVFLKPDKTSLSDHKLVELQSVGIQLQIPQHWQQRQLSSGHHYFIYDGQGKVLLEVRPNCLDALEIDTPTYLSNILQLFEAHNAGAQYESRCAQIGTDKNCLVQVKYPRSGPIKEKWHWLEIPIDESRTFALDFVLLEDLPALKAEVWDVIFSVAILSGKATEPCRTPAAWL